MFSLWVPVCPWFGIPLSMRPKNVPRGLWLVAEALSVQNQLYIESYFPEAWTNRKTIFFSLPLLESKLTPFPKTWNSMNTHRWWWRPHWSYRLEHQAGPREHYALLGTSEVLWLGQKHPKVLVKHLHKLGVTMSAAREKLLTTSGPSMSELVKWGKISPTANSLPTTWVYQFQGAQGPSPGKPASILTCQLEKNCAQEASDMRKFHKECRDFSSGNLVALQLILRRSSSFYAELA